MATIDREPLTGDGPGSALSERQVETLRHISQGLNVEEAGRTMAVSARTAKRHLEEARTRLGARRTPTR